MKGQGRSVSRSVALPLCQVSPGTARVAGAWNAAARRYSGLKNYAPVSARFSTAKGTFYRLSVQGFANGGEASRLCQSIRNAGGTCFVRTVAGDRPMQIASR